MCVFVINLQRAGFRVRIYTNCWGHAEKVFCMSQKMAYFCNGGTKDFHSLLANPDAMAAVFTSVVMSKQSEVACQLYIEQNM